MQFIAIAALAGLASANVFARQQCNADNCARQVRVTQFNEGDDTATQVQRSVDCTSFLQATVSTRVGGSATTIFPSAVPTYASSCTVGGTTDFARYSSACVNCVGVNPAPTTIVAGCNADLCSRGLFGTRVPSASAAANTEACRSFLLTTVSLDVEGPGTTIIPTAIPSAAVSACTAIGETAGPSARFSSACNCAGLFASTTVLAAPTDA